MWRVVLVDCHLRGLDLTLMLKQTALLTASLLMAATAVHAKDQITIVGSSTVYPFSAFVAEELGATTPFKTPIITSTGSVGGIKRFCNGNGLDTPDFTNASRRMKRRELKKCQRHGVNDITEIVIGYDGIAIAQNRHTTPMHLTSKTLMLAVASEVPNRAGNRLIANPYHYWNEIDPNLPHRKISIYGPPTSSGTRGAFEDMILKRMTKQISLYTNLYHADNRYRAFHDIREDGVYIPSGENDNLIVQRLNKYRDAIGIFGYSYLQDNRKLVAAISVDGITPSPETVESGSYPLSRSLYFYVKKSHLGKVPGMRSYAKLFTSERMIGDDGDCIDIGLIPLPKKLRAHYRQTVQLMPSLTAADLTE